MELRIHPLTLRLARPFTISRGTLTEQQTLIVELRDSGVSGYGEVTQNDYYGHSTRSLIDAIAAAKPVIDRYVAETPEQVWPDLMRSLRNNAFAASAVDMAAHDWHARQAGIPLRRAWGLEDTNIPASSYTIAIDAVDTMQQKLVEQPDWPIYKIKLGTSRDLEIVRALRPLTGARFRVDANCGWTARQTIELSGHLAELGVEFIEQPLPAEASLTEHRRVWEASQLPIIADESCQLEGDVTHCHELFHGINVKVCKCGGLTPALRMLRQARQLGMRTMVGCMIESSIGISAAAQLLPLLDYADLDGAALLASDPAGGVVIDRGQVQLSSAPGHGGWLRDQPATDSLATDSLIVPD